MENEIFEEIKKKYKNSNKYVLNLTYEDIGILIHLVNEEKETDYISKDKIKAKIEPKLKELDEQINEEWKKYGNSKELQDMEDMYNFLQSLLEKE